MPNIKRRSVTKWIRAVAEAHGKRVGDIGYMFVAISILNWNKMLSKIIANAIVIIANYALSRFFIFKNQTNG